MCTCQTFSQGDVQETRAGSPRAIRRLQCAGERSIKKCRERHMPDLGSSMLSQGHGVIIDDRETALFDSATRLESGVHLVRERLRSGDIHILSSDQTPALVIERKSRADLRASLIDGRFHSQRARMVSEFGADRVCFVIEGSTCWSDPESGAEIGLIMRDRIPVFWSSGIDDTAALVVRLASSNGAAIRRQSREESQRFLDEPGNVAICDAQVHSRDVLTTCVYPFAYIRLHGAPGRGDPDQQGGHSSPHLKVAHIRWDQHVWESSRVQNRGVRRHLRSRCQKSRKSPLAGLSTTGLSQFVQCCDFTN
jgi:ERCC4-type nuclease